MTAGQIIVAWKAPSAMIAGAAADRVPDRRQELDEQRVRVRLGDRLDHLHELAGEPVRTLPGACREASAR